MQVSQRVSITEAQLTRKPRRRCKIT